MDNLIKNYFSSAFGIIALLLFSAQASAALTNVVKISQGETVAAISGGTLTVDVVGENFSPLGPDGAAFSLSWNPNVLQYVSTSFLNPIWNFTSADETQAAAGVIDPVLMGISTLGVNAGSDFGLVSFTFNVVGNPGEVSGLVLGNDAYGIGFINGETGLNVNYVNSQVQVVPLPAAIWMFSAGLAGVMGAMKRRKAA